MKHLSEKEKLFCAYYKQGRNAREAAAKCGFRFAEKSAVKLLSKDEIRNELFGTKENKESEISAGYRRLAFGCNADAVGLLFSDEPTKEDVEKMDLFGVSEIKRQNGERGCTIEIKFFDRLKALEKLEMNEQSKNDDGESRLYGAIEKSAKALAENEHEQL